MSRHQERYPLVVVSHGTGGSAASLSWVCTRLAQAGYVVAAPNHHGNTGSEPRRVLEGFLLWWERAIDLRVLTDRLLADPDFGARIDAQRVGVAGFSLGGYTALAAVGARLKRDGLRDYCRDNDADPICRLPPEADDSTAEAWAALEDNPRVRAGWEGSDADHRDRRFRGAFVLAPVAGPVLTDESLAAIDVPVRLVVGSADDQSLPETNALRVARAIPGATAEVIPKVGHYTFLCPGTWWGRLVAPGLLRDPRGVNRRRVHETVGRDVVRFFDTILTTGGPHGNPDL